MAARFWILIAPGQISRGKKRRNSAASVITAEFVEVWEIFETSDRRKSDETKI
jgi:hypothetical protein